MAENLHRIYVAIKETHSLGLKWRKETVISAYIDAKNLLHQARICTGFKRLVSFFLTIPGNAPAAGSADTTVMDRRIGALRCPPCRR
ncbi:hypothetical protein [Pseudoxanthobacter soli]|uniref:hypothetical protein n=1 Tax=Pseudoxanthobacter soli TaxID=433840 RepID=UPI001114B86F|nr:hypothetical protein [Pseudoxanthobacter soli]